MQFISLYDKCYKKTNKQTKPKKTQTNKIVVALLWLLLLVPQGMLSSGLGRKRHLGMVHPVSVNEEEYLVLSTAG